MDYKSKKSTLSGEKSQGSGHKSDKPQQNNSTSRVDADHGGGIIHCPVTKNMKHLLDEFKGLYEERLRRLEFDTRGGTHEDILQVGEPGEVSLNSTAGHFLSSCLHYGHS